MLCATAQFIGEGDGIMLLRISARTITALAAVATAVLTAQAVAQTSANGAYYALPSWDQQLHCDTLASCPRFVVLANWNNEAVLDRETGLVWERTPFAYRAGAFPYPAAATFSQAWDACQVFDAIGGRVGWRLPRIAELLSLLDARTLTLPAGNPFQNVYAGIDNITGLPAGLFWAADGNPTLPSLSYRVKYPQAGGYFVNGIAPSSSGVGYWCVRGPSS
jgi:hypothetical protein